MNISESSTLDNTLKSIYATRPRTAVREALVEKNDNQPPFSISSARSFSDGPQQPILKIFLTPLNSAKNGLIWLKKFCQVQIRNLEHFCYQDFEKSLISKNFGNAKWNFIFLEKCPGPDRFDRSIKVSGPLHDLKIRQVQKKYVILFWNHRQSLVSSVGRALDF